MRCILADGLVSNTGYKGHCPFRSPAQNQPEKQREENHPKLYNVAGKTSGSVLG